MNTNPITKIPSAAHYRPTGLLTGLRPDYYEWFPVFSDLDLIARASRMPLHVATLLIPRNIERLIQLKPQAFAWVRNLSFASSNSQSHETIEMLLHLGFPDIVTTAMVRVSRTAFVPERYRSLSWFNRSIWYDDTSCLSATGLVALMATAVSRGNYSHLVEIGSGGGYQLVLFSELFKAQTAVGWEANPAVAMISRHTCEAYSGSTHLSIQAGPFSIEEWPKESNTLVYATCGLDYDTYETYERLLRPGQSLLAPHTMSKEEYHAIEDTGFKLIYPSWEHYQERRDYLQLSQSVVVNEQIIRRTLLRDVAFVPMVASVSPGQSIVDAYAEYWLELLRL